jgi:hypothetical protein
MRPDDLTPRDDANRSRLPDSNKGGGSRPTGDSGRLADREVPIELTRTPDLIHAWLDGELAESQVRGSESARHVNFWKRLDSDLEVRRQAMAPVDLTERIMAALPNAAPMAVSPWWNRTVAMTPLAVAASAAALLGLGAAIGASLKGH